MTAKQKLAIVAAQYIAHAREVTRSGDLMSVVAEKVSEERAKGIVEALEAEGLIDAEGILASGASAAKVFGGAN